MAQKNIRVHQWGKGGWRWFHLASVTVAVVAIWFVGYLLAWLPSGFLGFESDGAILIGSLWTLLCATFLLLSIRSFVRADRARRG